MSIDTGSARYLTHWEQIDDGKPFTESRKFLTVAPIIMFVLHIFFMRLPVQDITYFFRFLLACLYTKNDQDHFIANFLSLIVVLLPKLPQFHGVRLFGINKY